MITKVITIKMEASKPIKVYFNPPLQNVHEIQFVEYHNNYDGFLIICDAIDPNFSLSNISEKSSDFVTLKPSNILAVFSDTNLPKNSNSK